MKGSVFSVSVALAASVVAAEPDAKLPSKIEPIW